MSEIEIELDSKDLKAAKLERDLDASAFEWSKMPTPLQPGESPLFAKLAELSGLPVGIGVTVDEWAELAFVFIHNLPPSRPSRRKQIREFVWAAIRAKTGNGAEPLPPKRKRRTPDVPRWRRKLD